MRKARCTHFPLYTSCRAQVLEREGSTRTRFLPRLENGIWNMGKAPWTHFPFDTRCSFSQIIVVFIIVSSLLWFLPLGVCYSFSFSFLFLFLFLFLSSLPAPLPAPFARQTKKKGRQTKNVVHKTPRLKVRGWGIYHLAFINYPPINLPTSPSKTSPVGSQARFGINTIQTPTDHTTEQTRNQASKARNAKAR